MTRPLEIDRAGVDDEAALIPLMVAFNASERTPWQPETMAPRLLMTKNLIEETLPARDRPGDR